MTMPHLMNCGHSSDGWCLECVGRLQARSDDLVASLKEMRDACAACMRFANDRMLGLQLCEYIAKAQVEDGFGSRADELIGAIAEGIY